MNSERTRIRLSKEQPILDRARRRRAKRPAAVRSETDFWQHFDLDKFARDWQRGLGKRAARA